MLTADALAEAALHLSVMAPPEIKARRSATENTQHPASQVAQQPTYLRRLFQDFDGKCAYCEHATFIPVTRSGHVNRATIDHMVTLSRGGSKSYENLALACFGCNNLKGNMTVREFQRAMIIVAAVLAVQGARE